MAESYAVEATLEWQSNVPAVIREMVAGFERVNRLITDTRSALGSLAGDLRDVASSSRGIGALARSMEKLKIPVGALNGIRDMASATRGLAEAESAMARDAASAAKSWTAMAEASRKMHMPGGIPGARSSAAGGISHVNAMDTAMAGQMFGDAGLGLLEKGYHAYAEVQLQTVMAQADKRVSDAVMGRANSVIATLQKQYPALTQAEGLTLFRNTMGIFGNADESLDALPGAARLQQLYQLAPIGRGGTGGSEVQAAEKAGDAMQAFIDPKTQKLDRGLYGQWMDFQARSYLAGGGLVDAQGWLAFARTSRSAGIGLSPRALEETQALLEMSPGRTGTALMSAFQVFGASTSHMTNKNRAAWNDARLLGKDGDIVNRQLYQKDPYDWVWSEMLPRLAAKGVKDRDQILRWLTDHGQRGTVSGILADIAIGRTPITNTATKMESQNPNAVDKLVNTDVGKLAALHAAETNFFVALGKFGEGPGLKLLTNLTDGLNKLTDWANAHPETATRIITIGGGLALLSKVAGDTAMATIFVGGPLVRGIGALGTALLPFSGGGPAGTALTALGAAKSAGSLFALAGGILALGAAMAGLPPLMNWLLSDPAHQRMNAGNKNEAPVWGPGGPPKDPEGWTKFWSGASAAPGTNSRGGHPTLDRVLRPQPIQITNYTVLDGKVVAKSVARYIAGQLNANAGPTGGDSRAVFTAPGAVGQ